jgi:hypothetical protein
MPPPNDTTVLIVDTSYRIAFLDLTEDEWQAERAQAERL